MLDIHRAALELSMYMSISMSMSMSMSMSISMVVPSSPPSPIPTPGPSTSVPMPPKNSPRPTGPPRPPGPPITPAPFSTAPIPTRPTGSPGPPGLPITPAPFSRIPIPTRGPIPSGPPRPTEPGPQSPPSFLIPPVFGTPSKDPSIFSPSLTPQTPSTEAPFEASSIEKTTETSTSSAPTGVYLPNSDCLRTSAIRLGEASDGSTTPMSLEIGYIAESNSNSVESFMTELEEELIATAVFAIFGCNPETSGIIVPITLEIVNGKRTR